jgi:hypothetical protein
VTGERWDKLPISVAQAAATAMPLPQRDQAAATLRDDLDQWGISVTDEAALFAYLVGHFHIVRHISIAVSRGAAPPAALQYARAAYLARLSFLLPYLPEEARR